MLNSFSAVGRLGKETELAYTPNGKAVAKNSLAITRDYKNSDGERETDWLPIILWGKTGELFANYTHKGSLVSIQARIETRNYENNSGQRIYVTEVIVERFNILDKREDSQNNAQRGTGASYGNQSSNYQQSTQNGPQKSYSNAGSQPNGYPDVNDDDLPF